jgi:hypothetical protein
MCSIPLSPSSNKAVLATFLFLGLRSLYVTERGFVWRSYQGGGSEASFKGSKSVVILFFAFAPSEKVLNEKL